MASEDAAAIARLEAVLSWWRAMRGGDLFDGIAHPDDLAHVLELARGAEAAWRENMATFERLRNACVTRQYALDDARRSRARVAELEAATASAAPEDGAGEGAEMETLEETERRYANLFQSLALEVSMAETSGQRRHFTRMLEMACRKLRTEVWHEVADVGAAVSLAAGEEP